VDHRAIHLHVDLAGHDDGVVDRVGAVVARLHAGAELDDAQDRAAGKRGADRTGRRVVVAVIVYGETFRGPDRRDHGAGPALLQLADDFVDLDDRLAVRVVAGDDAADLECHVFLPLAWSNAIGKRQMPQARGLSVGNFDASVAAIPGD